MTLTPIILLEGDTNKGDVNKPLSSDDAEAAMDLGKELALDVEDHRNTNHYTQDGKYPTGIPHVHIDRMGGKLRHIPALPKCP